jgi:hypothetical protein
MDFNLDGGVQTLLQGTVSKIHHFCFFRTDQHQNFYNPTNVDAKSTTFSRILAFHRGMRQHTLNMFTIASFHRRMEFTQQRIHIILT